MTLRSPLLNLDSVGFSNSLTDGRFRRISVCFVCSLPLPPLFPLSPSPSLSFTHSLTHSRQISHLRSLTRPQRPVFLRRKFYYCPDGSGAYLWTVRYLCQMFSDQYSIYFRHFGKPYSTWSARILGVCNRLAKSVVVIFPKARTRLINSAIIGESSCGRNF